MAKAKQQPAVRQMNIKEIRAQLDLLTAKMNDYECSANRCSVNGCKFVADGLRLSQEVEILQKQNAALRKENEALKSRLAGIRADLAAGQ